MARRVIGLDASRLASAGRTGTETYTARLLTHLAPDPATETLRLYLNRTEAPPGLPPGAEAVCIPFPRLWTHARLAWEVTRRPPDVLFVPAHVVPPLHPPTVVTVHDLGYLHEPEAHPPAQRRYLDLSTRWSARAARRVIVPSGATRDDLVARYLVPPERIRVIPHGVDPAFRPFGAEAADATRRRLGLPGRYVLAVGTVQPRKNLGRLAAGFRATVAAGLPHVLVLAGKRGWLADRVEAEVTASGLGDRVRWLGHVPDADLPALYAAADAFCLPSLYEGFGLPALEALACGVPTLVADRSSLPEVAGDAALLVDPFSNDGIGAALVRLLTDVDLRARLSAAGPARAAAFGWDKTAAMTLEVLREVMDLSGGLRRA